MDRIDPAAILKTAPEWQAEYDNFVVDAEVLNILRAGARDLTIDVYLGTWCSDSRHNVPRFIKIIDALESPGMAVNYFTVDRKADRSVKYYVEEREVERVPTFIFLRDGREIGRIIENPKKTLPEDFADIVR